MATYYVSTTASGGGDGSSGDPFTQAEAASTATSGDTVLVNPGTYATWTEPSNNGTTTSPIIWQANGGTVTFQDYFAYWTGTNHRFIDLDWVASYSSWMLTAGAGVSRNLFLRCTFKNTGTGGGVTLNSATLTRLVGCFVESAANTAIAAAGASLRNCTLRTLGGTAAAVTVTFGGNGNEDMHGCTIYNAGTGDCVSINAAATYSYAIGKCAIYGGGDGIAVGVGSADHPVTVTDCIIYGQGGYCINSSFTDTVNLVVCNNALGGATSGITNGLGNFPEIDSITLTVDPFTDAANADFSLNNTAGGGALCRGAGLVPPTS